MPNPSSSEALGNPPAHDLLWQRRRYAGSTPCGRGLRQAELRESGLARSNCLITRSFPGALRLRGFAASRLPRLRGFPGALRLRGFAASAASRLPRGAAASRLRGFCGFAASPGRCGFAASAASRLLLGFAASRLRGFSPLAGPRLPLHWENTFLRQIMPGSKKPCKTQEMQYLLLAHSGNKMKFHRTLSCQKHWTNPEK